MIAFRELVEGQPARQAANRFTSASLANLRWIYDQMLELVGRAKQGEWSDGPFETALPLDAAFHRDLLDAASNPMATRLVEDLRLDASIHLKHSNRCCLAGYLFLNKETK